MNDQQLLHQFVHDRSQQAFRELVQRHTDWLYSVCLRRLRDPSLAEDATQAIFLALARKAPALLHHPTLSLWLHQAAKFACHNIQRAEQRRARHESEAAAMTPTTTADWLPLESDLEPALDHLPARDRQTLLLRFYEQRSHAQIAATLHISEAAAHKRLARALDRLRNLLLSRGHHDLTAAALPTLLLSHPGAPAPATLTPTHPGTATATIPAHLAPATNGILHALTWLKLQLWGAIAAATTGAIVLGTTGFVLAHHALAASPVIASTPASAPPLVTVSAPNPPTAPTTVPANTFVLKLANQDFIFNKTPNSDEFQVDTDPTVKRTPASEPANHIKSLVEALLQPNTPVERSVVTPAFLFHGKRIRLTAWVKTADVQNWATLRLYLLDTTGRLYIFGDLAAHPIHGTTDWTQYELVADVPTDASMIGISTAIYGTGEVWSDDFQISVVPPNTPTSDDQNWLKWSFYAPLYSAEPDPDEPHDNHPSIRLAYIGPASAPKDAWGQYNHQMRDIHQYAGHRLRISFWIKTEKAGYCGPNMRTRAPDGQILTRDSGYMHRTLRGTHDWQLYSTECNIPKEATAIDSGVVLNGKGKLWIDLNSVKYEIVDGEPTP